MDYIIKLQELTKDIPHGDETLLSHCLEVYNILKEIDLEESVCIAGLYHSIYSTEFFKHNATISREELKNIIGDYSESLVYEFCNLEDRDNNLLNNLKDYNDNMYYDLLCIAYANLKTQENRPGAHILLDKFSKKIESLENKDSNLLKVNNQDIFVLDNALPHYYLDKLFTFCRNSSFTPDHGSSELKVTQDARFVSYLNETDLESIEYKTILKSLLPKFKIKKVLDSYINVYNVGAFNNPHTDTSLNNHWSILVFPNTEWNNLWGGETKFYNQGQCYNYTVDYVPGRIIIFDSRLQHHALTINHSCPVSRYSLVFKCVIDE